MVGACALLPLVPALIAATLCIATAALTPRAQHAAFPDRFFGFPFDWIFATGCAVRGRKIVITGASGAFGAPFKQLLEAHGAHVTPLKYGTDYTYDDYARAE